MVGSWGSNQGCIFYEHNESVGVEVQLLYKSQMESVLVRKERDFLIYIAIDVRSLRRIRQLEWNRPIVFYFKLNDKRGC